MGLLCSEQVDYWYGSHVQAEERQSLVWTAPKVSEEQETTSSSCKKFPGSKGGPGDER